MYQAGAGSKAYKQEFIDRAKVEKEQSARRARDSAAATAKKAAEYERAHAGDSAKERAENRDAASAGVKARVNGIRQAREAAARKAQPRGR